MKVPNRISIGKKLDKAYNRIYKDFRKNDKLEGGVSDDLRATVFFRLQEIVNEIELYEEYLGKNYY